MLCLLNILSSFSAVYELLADTNVTPRSFYNRREMPKGIIVYIIFFDQKHFFLLNYCFELKTYRVFWIELHSLIEKVKFQVFLTMSNHMCSAFGNN
jgi:hypothetical protein